MQKLQVHWRLPSQDTRWLQDVECVKAFRLDPGVGRKSCTVCFERYSCQAMWIQRRDLAAWSSLARFEEVVFRKKKRKMLNLGRMMIVNWKGIYRFNGKHIYVAWSKSTIEHKEDFHRKLLRMLPAGVRMFGRRELHHDGTSFWRERWQELSTSRTRNGYGECSESSIL